MEPRTPNKPKLSISGEEPTELNEIDPVVDAEGDDDTALSIAPAPAALSSRDTDRPSRAPLVPGEMIGDYRIERLIGKGGMGTVYEVLHPKIGKRAAAKVLNAELCTDPYTIERFVDEARVVNEIGHPNIIDVFAFGEMIDGRHFFVMEYMPGETLHSRLQRPISLGEAINILRQLCRALDAAHAKGVIHRDLKPDNIFLLSQPDQPLRVKLLDFGIAKLVREDRRIERTATGAMVGTPLYIAPEQAKGHAIDGAVDIYAMGGIAFELLTGRPPFVADNAMEIVAKHLMEEPPRASQLANVPRALDDLVFRMLAKDPKARPTLRRVLDVLDSAFEWSMDLSALPAGDPHAALGATSAHQAATIAPHRGRVVLLAILGMFAVGGLTFAVVSWVTDGGSSTPAGNTKLRSTPVITLVDARVDVVEAAPVVTPVDAAPTPAPLPIDAAAVVVAHDSDTSDTAIKRPPPPPLRTPRQQEPSVQRLRRPVESAAEPPATGRLMVSVKNNDQFTVVVDNVDRGHADMLTLPVGKHTVELRFANEKSHFFTVDILANATQPVVYVSRLGDLIGPGSTTRKGSGP